ncbi:MAG: IS5/IS1182 family transposase [Nocardioides sp.]|nr:IS5/IS1182 family transposase [Nocardioides sp.]
MVRSTHAAQDRRTFDLRWKAACGFAVDAAGFHPSTLTYWRRRLAASDRPHRVFDAVRDVIAQTDVLGGKTRRALDSTILDDAVARQDTVTQLIAQIRRDGREIPAVGRVVAMLPGHDYTRPGKPDIAWDDQAARDDLVSRLVTDATTLLAALEGVELDERQQDAVALLALVAGQDVEPADGSDGTDGRWRIARQVAADRVISTVDPDTRHAHKSRQKRQDGFIGHLIAEPDTGLVTAAVVSKASGPDNSDAARGIELLASDTSIGDTSIHVLGDSAYGSGPMLAALAQAGHIALVKPMPLRAAVPGGFTIDDFTIDEDARTATCPAGHTRPVTTKRHVTFGAICRSCPLAARCTTSVRGRKLDLTAHDRLLREHRARAATTQFQEPYRQHRPMVERTIAWMTRGARRVPYRGVSKNNAWWTTRAAAINLKRLLTLGLSIEDGTWALT